MPFVYADRVRETSTSTGTGTFALAGAVTGFRTFASGIGANNTCFYTISHQTASEWEVGYGTLDSLGTTLTRTTVQSSSTGSAVVFSAGTKDVFVTIPASALSPISTPNSTGSALQALALSPFGTSAGNTAELRLLELAANGTNYIGFKSPDSIASNLIWTLPNADGGKGQYLQTNGSGTLSWNGGPYPCQGRLTLASGTPVAINVTGSVLYFTPYVGNLLALYNTTRNVWENHTLTEISFTPVGGWSANTNYDIFVYNLSGTLTLTAAIWTNNTTRATGITKQDGVLVMSGQVSYRYIGTVRCTNTANTLADTDGFRLVWNYYNRIMRGLFCADTTQWTYGGAGSTTQRFSNNNYANRVDIVCGETQGGVFYLSVDSNRNAVGTTFVSLGQQSATIPTGTPATQMGTILYPASFGSNANMLSVQTNHSRSLFQDFNAAYYAIHGVEWNNNTTFTSTFVRHTILGCWAC